jgi:hypothetical protein
MSDMSLVERVARAIAACDYLGNSAQERDALVDSGWRNFEEEARAAIAVISSEIHERAGSPIVSNPPTQQEKSNA